MALRIMGIALRLDASVRIMYWLSTCFEGLLSFVIFHCWILSWAWNATRGITHSYLYTEICVELDAGRIYSIGLFYHNFNLVQLKPFTDYTINMVQIIKLFINFQKRCGKGRHFWLPDMSYFPTIRLKTSSMRPWTLDSIRFSFYTFC